MSKREQYERAVSRLVETKDTFARCELKLDTNQHLTSVFLTPHPHMPGVEFMRRALRELEPKIRERAIALAEAECERLRLEALAEAQEFIANNKADPHG